MGEVKNASLSMREALRVLGLQHHEFDMRVKYQECFVCRSPMNFMRLYNDQKKYCAKHDDATGEIAEAIRVLNGT